MARKPSKTKPESPRHVNLSTLSTLLNRDRNTVTKWTDAPDFPIHQRANREAGLNWIFDVAEVVKWLERRASESAAVAAAGQFEEGHVDYEEAKRRKEVATATMAEITLDERLGEVALVSEMLDQIATEYAVLKASLQGVGGAVAPDLIGLDQPSHIQSIIDEAIVDALTALEEDEDSRRAALRPDPTDTAD